MEFSREIAQQVFKTYRADKIPITSKSLVHPEVFSDAKFYCDVLAEARDALCISIDTYVVGMSEKRIRVHRKWPKDWWHAFKDRWFPAFLLRRWPVQYEEIDIDEVKFSRVCPHVRIPDEKVHLEWLANG